jgi:epoxyqueuosine reductase
MSLADHIKELASNIGFDRVGIAPAAEADGFDRLADWLARGFAGDMGYMTKHAEARRHPESILPSVRSVVMVALNYRAVLPPSGPGRGEGWGEGEQNAARNLEVSAGSAPSPPAPLPRSTGGEGSGTLIGKIAQYALGRDYHDVLREKLNRLLALIQADFPHVAGRGVVDTAPLLERDFARRAGLGWFGKNTMLIHPKLGSFFFLGALLLDIDLPADAPFATSHCGTCTRCLDACPTDAFPAPGWLDSRRCISYLTIEKRGAIDEELRPGLENWIFGCDICQDVCPWNRKAPFASDPALAPRDELVAPDLLRLLEISEDEFRRQFRGTALFRAKRSGLVRNVAVVLGNASRADALPALGRVRSDPDPVIREAAEWAIAQIRRRLILLETTEPTH